MRSIFISLFLLFCLSGCDETPGSIARRIDNSFPDRKVREEIEKITPASPTNSEFFAPNLFEVAPRGDRIFSITFMADTPMPSQATNPTIVVDCFYDGDRCVSPRRVIFKDKNYNEYLLAEFDSDLNLTGGIVKDKATRQECLNACDFTNVSAPSNFDGATRLLDYCLTDCYLRNEIGW